MAMTCITGGKECNGCMECRQEEAYEGRSREEIVEGLLRIKDWHRDALTLDERDTISDACNMLEAMG